MNSNKSLVPTFVYPSKRRGFDDAFKSCNVMLENLSISDDLTLAGLVRVNSSQFQPDDNADADIHVVSATYTKNSWDTSHESAAVEVATVERPDLAGVECKNYKFVIDCADMEVGSALEMYVRCGDTANKESSVDDNGRQFYKVSCTKKLNEWAAMAARELNNYAPTVKFNKNYFE